MHCGIIQRGDLQVQLSAVRRFFKRNPMSIIDVGKRIADKVLEREVYSAA
jgi:hypothetical protein